MIYMFKICCIFACWMYTYVSYYINTLYLLRYHVVLLTLMLPISWHLHRVKLELVCEA